MHPRTFGLLSALFTLTAFAQTPEPTCGPCAAGAQCVAGSCQFLCSTDTDCRHENVCIAGHCEPRLPVQRAGSPATIRRGDATHAERYKESRPVPPGFHPAQEPHWELVARGGIAFGLAWVPAGIIAVATRTPVIAIPFAGPILGYRRLEDPVLNAFAIAGIALDVSVQVFGVCMAIAGFAKPMKWLERDVSLVPGAPGAPLGASVRGRF